MPASSSSGADLRRSARRRRRSGGRAACGASRITSRVRAVVGVERAHRVQVDPVADLLGQLVLVCAQEDLELLAVLGSRLRGAEARQLQPVVTGPRARRAGRPAARSARRRSRARSSRSPRRRPARTGGSDLAAAPRRGRTSTGTRASPAARACASRAGGTPGTPARCPPGRSVSERPAPSSNVYISFCTMSVASPTPRANSSVASNVGRLDPPVAGRAEDLLGLLLDHLPARRGLGEDVERAARGLNHRRLTAPRARAGTGSWRVRARAS